MEEEKDIKTDNNEEIDISRDQAQIVSMLRIQSIEELLVKKGVVSQEELLSNFESLNSNFIDKLVDFTKTRREAK